MANKVKALQEWCRQKCMGYDGIEVNNMTSSWRDGLAFCAIIHRYHPELINFDSLDKKNVFENNKLAFEVGAKLGISPFLDAADMVAMRTPDRLSIITYVSQFYQVFGQQSLGKKPTKRQASTSNFPSENKNENNTLSKTIKKIKCMTKDRSGVSSSEQQQASQKTPNNILHPVNNSDDNNKDVCSNSKSHGGEDVCNICKEKVYLMERHQVDNTLYHRHCFRDRQRSDISEFQKDISSIVNRKEDKENKRSEGETYFSKMAAHTTANVLKREKEYSRNENLKGGDSDNGSFFFSESQKIEIERNVNGENRKNEANRLSILSQQRSQVRGKGHEDISPTNHCNMDEDQFTTQKLDTTATTHTSSKPPSSLSSTTLTPSISTADDIAPREMNHNHLNNSRHLSSFSDSLIELGKISNDQATSSTYQHVMDQMVKAGDPNVNAEDSSSLNENSVSGDLSSVSDFPINNNSDLPHHTSSVITSINTLNGFRNIYMKGGDTTELAFEKAQSAKHNNSLHSREAKPSNNSLTSISSLEFNGMDVHLSNKSSKNLINHHENALNNHHVSGEDKLLVSHHLGFQRDKRPDASFISINSLPKLEVLEEFKESNGGYGGDRRACEAHVSQKDDLECSGDTHGDPEASALKPRIERKCSKSKSLQNSETPPSLVQPSQPIQAPSHKIDKNPSRTINESLYLSKYNSKEFSRHTEDSVCEMGEQPMELEVNESFGSEGGVLNCSSSSSMVNVSSETGIEVWKGEVSKGEDKVKCSETSAEASNRGNNARSSHAGRWHQIKPDVESGSQVVTAAVQASTEVVACSYKSFPCKPLAGGQAPASSLQTASREPVPVPRQPLSRRVKGEDTLSSLLSILDKVPSSKQTGVKQSCSPPFCSSIPDLLTGYNDDSLVLCGDELLEDSLMSNSNRLKMEKEALVPERGLKGLKSPLRSEGSEVVEGVGEIEGLENIERVSGDDEGKRKENREGFDGSKRVEGKNMKRKVPPRPPPPRISVALFNTELQNQTIETQKPEKPSQQAPKEADQLNVLQQKHLELQQLQKQHLELQQQQKNTAPKGELSKKHTTKDFIKTTPIHPKTNITSHPTSLVKSSTHIQSNQSFTDNSLPAKKLIKPSSLFYLPITNNTSIPSYEHSLPNLSFENLLSSSSIKGGPRVKRKTEAIQKPSQHPQKHQSQTEKPQPQSVQKLQQSTHQKHQNSVFETEQDMRKEYLEPNSNKERDLLEKQMNEFQDLDTQQHSQQHSQQQQQLQQKIQELQEQISEIKSHHKPKESSLISQSPNTPTTISLQTYPKNSTIPSKAPRGGSYPSAHTSTFQSCTTSYPYSNSDLTRELHQPPKPPRPMPICHQRAFVTTPLPLTTSSQSSKKKIIPGNRLKLQLQLSLNSNLSEHDEPYAPGTTPSFLTDPYLYEKAKMSLVSKLAEVDKRLKALEAEGRLLEDAIRNHGDDDEQMMRWFELIEQRNDLLRDETEFIYRYRQLEYERDQVLVDKELRTLMLLPEFEKSLMDREREDILLCRKVELVSLRNNIIENQECDRIRYLKEDKALTKNKHAALNNK